jgi:hypothetical protein
MSLLVISLLVVAFACFLFFVPALVSHLLTFFLTIHGQAALGKLTKTCFACILFHHAWLRVNHVFITTSHIHLNAELLAWLVGVQTSYPWNDHTFAFTGIPLHILVLHELLVI